MLMTEYQDARFTYYAALEKHPHLASRSDLHPEQWVRKNVVKHKGRWSRDGENYFIQDREVFINDKTRLLYQEALEKEASK